MVSLRDRFLKDYNLLGCIQCGRCAAGCPISLRSQLNPRRLIYRIIVGETPGSLAERPELWDCTTCGTCATYCPKSIHPFDLVIGMRSLMVERGKISETVRDALENIYKYGNPYGKAREKRSLWAQGLDIKELNKGTAVEVLYFVGCAASYDPRAQHGARAMSLVLKKAGVDFAILGSSEICCGNEVRRMGEEGLFEELSEKNSNLFRDYSFKTMVTTSPHCYHAFVNEYKGLSYPVVHYTEFIRKLIKEKRLSLTKKVVKTVTYHDPCFLGKQNDIYEEPREILKSIPELKLIEFDRSRSRSLCCEGGGGRMWQEGTVPTDRTAEKRVHDALAMGVEAIVTACPFCLLTLEDAVKTTGSEERLKVLDIAEVVAEALGND